MNAQNSRLKQIIDYFASKSIAVPKQWITDVLSVSDSADHHSVYRQWLNTDLKAMHYETAQLPHDINVIKTDDQKQTAIKSTLYGKYALQINSIIDISKPKQLSMTDSVDDDVLEDESDQSSDEESSKNMFKRRKQVTKKETRKRGARMLSMMLTDGITQCQAIEYKPIQCLSADTPIGTKIILSGPFDIYGAVLLLNSSHISLLGLNSNN